MLSPKALICALAATVSIVVVANFAVGRAASNSVPRQMLRSIESAPPHIDVLGVGNSLMAAGFNAQAVEQAFRVGGRHITAMNAGIGATGLIEHVALVDTIYLRHTVTVAIYGFYNQQMSTDIPSENSELIGNRSMLYYLEPWRTLQFARFDWSNRLAFEIYRCCELLMDRSAIWNKVELLRRHMGEVGMPHQETNAFGRRADFNLLESTNEQTFVDRCNEVLLSKNVLSGPVLALLNETRKHSTTLIVTAMPMHPLHVKRFYQLPVWSELSGNIKTSVERQGAVYLDASRWIPSEDDFADHLHLSEEGSRKFSDLLARYLEAQPPFAPAVASVR
jgi:hypothetical protein